MKIGLMLLRCMLPFLPFTTMPLGTNDSPEVSVVEETESYIYEDEEEEVVFSCDCGSDIFLLAWICIGEAEGESEYGKRLVIDTILNRVDNGYFPDSVEGVVYQSGQFSCTFDGRLDRCYPDDYYYQLVSEELSCRSNYDVIYFMAGGFSDYGTPLFQEGNHYFSGE